MEPVYVLLAWACLVVFLQLDDSVDMERVRTFPLVLYAAEHLVNRANFENVEPKIENASKDLFNSMKPHHLTWTWIYNVEDRFFRPLSLLNEQPPALGTTTFILCSVLWSHLAGKASYRDTCGRCK